jgi:hypothetical protein
VLREHRTPDAMSVSPAQQVSSPSDR